MDSIHADGADALPRWVWDTRVDAFIFRHLQITAAALRFVYDFDSAYEQGIGWKAAAGAAIAALQREVTA